MTDAPELLPCPFCGEALVQNVAGGHWAHDAQSNGSCILSSMGVTDPAKWNTRAPPTLAEAMTVPEVRAEIERAFAKGHRAAADTLDSFRTNAFDLCEQTRKSMSDLLRSIADRQDAALANLKGPTP
jgi:hypothetical protein